MTNYKNGTRIEYILRDYYKSLGHEVLRAAGSRGPADLVVFAAPTVMLIQCKKTNTGSGLSEFMDDVKKLREIKVGGTVTKWLVVLRTKKKILDIHLIEGEEICPPSRLEWGHVLKIVDTYRRGHGKASR